jgi:hypothetical protein
MVPPSLAAFQQVSTLSPSGFACQHFSLRSREPWLKGAKRRADKLRPQAGACRQVAEGDVLKCS